jgi:diguanylate cyclase (GGDEF)-like protein
MDLFGEIRSSLAEHFELLNGIVAELSSLDDADESRCRVLAKAEQLSEKLALVYDEMRRFGDRLPASKESRLDPITMVGNQQALEEWLQMHFAYLSRYGNEFSIALFEIDMGANDADISSQQLNATACDITELLSENVRGTDKVFRYSANEFVVALPETPISGAVVFAERVIEDASKAVHCPVYGGIAGARQADSLRTLMNRADSALYQAKSESENSVCFHDGYLIGSPAETPYATQTLPVSG